MLFRSPFPATSVEAIEQLEPHMSELDAAGELSARVFVRGLSPFVVLVAGEERQPLHRHPLPTGRPLGRHALLAVTAEREGLHVSLTRLVSFGEPPAGLAELVRAAAEVDAAMLNASRPGVTTGEVHGREVFATPGEPTPLPELCAVAWNPSIAGGAKSEDTALVSPDGVEVLTRTQSLPEIDLRGVARPLVAPL